jgi:hypothetical protein
LGKDLAWPVAPAFYQRRAGLKPWEYGNSLGASRYLDAWFSALESKPTFIDLQTWNDFSEDTAVTDSNTTGEAFLHLTRYLADWLKSGQPQPVEQERVMLFRPKQLVRAELADSSAVTNNAAWRHRTPTVDYIDCVTLLRKPGRLEIRSGGAVWAADVPEGLHEFLIYAPGSAPPQRKGQAVAGPSSFPGPSSRRSITVADADVSGTPEAAVSRDGRVVLSVQSKIPLLTSGAFQDFTIIGDEAEGAWQP